MNDKSYIDWYSLSDLTLTETIGAFVKNQRIQRNLSQESVANSANISRSTLSLLERGQTVTLTTLLQVLRTLDLLHVMDAFRVQEQFSPLALAKIQQAQRKRGSGSKNRDDKENEW